MKRLLVGVLVVALGLALGGCKAISEKVGEKVGEKIVGAATGTDVDVNGDEVTIQTDEGDATLNSTEGKLPDDFPKDFPMYKQVAIDSTSSWASEGDTTFYVNLISKDGTRDVYDWYKSELTGKGWTVESDMYMSGDSEGGVLSAKKDDSTVTLSVTAEDGSSTIGIILAIAGTK